jgi:hypothetical protein
MSPVRTSHQSRLDRNAPVYLLVVDETHEFEIALEYAAKLAQANGAKIALLLMMDEDDFQHWGNIAERMQQEHRQQAEAVMWKAARRVNELTAMLPALYIEQGRTQQAITDVIDKDHNITKLILGGGTQSKSPGPLVAYFTGKGLPNLRVPVTIVPGNLAADDIGALV